MKTSKEIIKQAKDRFAELEHKNYDGRSFYNGFLEAQTKQLAIQHVVGRSEQLPKQCKCDNRTNGSEQLSCDGDCNYH